MDDEADKRERKKETALEGGEEAQQGQVQYGDWQRWWWATSRQNGPISI